MCALQVIFWLLAFLIFYTYLGYGILLFFLVKVKRLGQSEAKGVELVETQTPVAFLIAAYNEEDYIEEKIENSLALNYPKELLKIIVVTDGSSDTTPELVKKYPEVVLYHENERNGKIAAVQRVMPLIKEPIVIFSDANTIINPEAVKNIVRHYNDPEVGAVAGEKRVRVDQKEAANATEGFYWKYESQLKKWDSEFYSVVGAAGELFSIRRALYEPVPSNAIIEDFVMTLRITQRGFRVAYEPDAYALEGPSASVKEEFKRKVRIAAGGLQAIWMLKPLLNFFRYGRLSFQYISHRVLRWTVTPLALIVVFFLNAILIPVHWVYEILFAFQVLFYVLAFIGYLLSKTSIKLKAFFIPFYFCMMNYAVLKGFARIITKNQSVKWEKAKRA